MALAEKLYLKIVIDYLHDLAFGLFPGAVVGAWLIRRAAESLGTGQAAVSRAAGGLWLVMLLGLTISVVTGIVRLRYWKSPVRSEALQAKVTMVTLKHSFFVLTVVVSAVALYTIVT